MKRALISLSSIFGVVPDETSAWKPEIAPHAMVMNRNGKRLPANTGPVPSTNFVTAGILRSGSTKKMPSARPAIVPILRNVER